MGKWDKYKVSGEGSTESKWDKYKVSPAVSEERVAEKSPEMEKQNLMGQIFNVPGAAIRSAIQGKGFVQGAVNPSSVPTFQDTALNSYYGKLPIFPGKTALGMGVSALGMAGDVLTNPADMALALAGKAPGVNKAVGAVRKLAPAQAFEQWLTKERSVAGSMPKIMNNKWLMERAKTVKSVVDETIDGFRSQYKSLIGKNANNVVSNINTLPEDVIQEFNLTDKTTVQQLWDIRDQIISDISDSAWDRPNMYKRIRPNQKTLQEAASKIKAVVLNSLDDEARKEVLKIDPKYTEVMRTGKKLIRTVYEPSSGDYKIKPLINMLKSPESSRESFDKFVKFGSQLRQVEKDIGKYAARQTQKKIAKQVLIRGAEGVLIGGVLGSVMSKKR